MSCQFGFARQSKALEGYFSRIEPGCCVNSSGNLHASCIEPNVHNLTSNQASFIQAAVLPWKSSVTLPTALCERTPNIPPDC